MHVSIRHYSRVDSATDELIQSARRLALALSSAPGFVSYALLEMGDGALTSICVFESRLELDAGNCMIGSWLAEHLPMLEPMHASFEIGEIVLQRGM
jgi:hypothetical protein